MLLRPTPSKSDSFIHLHAPDKLAIYVECVLILLDHPIVDKIVESIDFNGILDAIRLYTDSPVPRSKPRPPREIFPRGHYMVDKRDDIRRRLRCVKVARQY